MSDVVKESVLGLKHGHTVVGLTAVQLTNAFPNFRANKGVFFRCPGDSDPNPNAHPVWVGGAVGVTAGSTSTGGVPVLPGDGIFIPIENLEDVWVVSLANNQDIAWLAI